MSYPAVGIGNGPTDKIAELYISVLGTNFGATNPTPSATTGATACLTSTWTTTSSVLCYLPGGAGAKRNVQITVSALVGTIKQVPARVHMRTCTDARSGSRVTHWYSNCIVSAGIADGMSIAGIDMRVPKKRPPQRELSNAV